MTEQHQPEKSIFLAAVEIGSAAERAAFLEKACAGDPSLRGEVEALLQAHERPLRLLGVPSAGAPTTNESRPQDHPGAAIGPYKLLQPIGEGGMGAVFLAEQTEPVHRKVALKLIKPGMDSRQVVARFEAERQALALMDHPNIAKVFDGGATEAGRPFFVMELVRGAPVTDFCDKNDLTVPERLALFIDVCRAVQHAHQKGVIHRDVKPSNVLVTLHDGKPVVKVIDFGVAKAIGRQLTEKTLFTDFAQMVGTPLYMSPEQAEMSGLDVDTRSDIYSLGVLLYELLTGTTPFDKDRLRRVGWDELRRIIREEEPPKPSTRMSTAGQAARTASAHRRSDPRKLSRLFRGELDWIVMKALEKDRNRRYETASAFAADVQRYLSHEPVQACPPSAWYRFRKFVRRRRAALATAATVLAAVLAAVGGVAGGVGWAVRDREARNAENERDVTAAVAEADTLLTEGDSQLDNPEHWQRTVRLARLATDRAEGLSATGGVRAELAEQVRRLHGKVETAETDSALLVELDRIRMEKAATKGDYDGPRVVPRYREALAGYGVNPQEPEAAAARVRGCRLRDALFEALDDWFQEATDPDEQRRVGRLLGSLSPTPADALFRTQWVDARKTRDRAAFIRLVNDTDAENLPIVTLTAAAVDLERLKEWKLAERLLRTALNRRPADFWLNHRLGRLLALKGRNGGPEAARHFAEAVGFFRVAVALRSDCPGALFNLGLVLHDKGDLDDALRNLRAALQLDPDFAEAHFALGNVLMDQRDPDGAIREFEAAVKINPRHSNAHNNLGGALFGKGDREGALREVQAALDIDPKNAQAHYNLGRFHYEVEKDLDEAIKEYRAAVAIDPNYAHAHYELGRILVQKRDWKGAASAFRAFLSLDPGRAEARYNLGLALFHQDQLSETVEEFQKSLAIEPQFAGAHSQLGAALLKQGKTPEAVVELQKALALDDKDVLAHTNLGSALSKLGKRDDAVAEYRKAAALDPQFFPAHYNLALILMQQGDLDGAADEFRKALAIDPNHAPAHVALGNILLEGQKDLDEAVAHYRAALAVAPNDAVTHYNLGLALSRQGKLDDAVVEYRQAVALNPQYARAHNNLGAALKQLGRLDEAAAELRKALAIEPRLVEAHGALAELLLEQGQFAEARDGFRRCLALLPERHPARPSVARQIGRCERLLDLEKVLPKVLAGEAQPADAGEGLELAHLCYLKKRYVGAAGLYADALPADGTPASDPRNPHRFNAARAAALAADGQGEDAGALDDAARARRRGQALEWLRADLTLWGELVDRDAPGWAAAARETLRRWQGDPALASLREDAALEKLPAAEQDAFRRLWADVRGLLGRVDGGR
jgi:tetratricopeptide (TPR) repeat protein/serine/threonine protein kinase